MTSRPSLFRQAAISIATGLLVFQLISGTGVLMFVLLPLAQRSADDFAALLVLSARTWVELPPETRPAFVLELESSHGLDLQEVGGTAGEDVGHHHPYMSFLRTALARRIDAGAVPQVTETADDRFHADIPMAGRVLRFSFSADRVNPQPLLTLGLTIVAALLVAGVLAWVLAKRVSAPFARFAAAARQIGAGERPPELPESGERELATLARVFNKTVAQLAAQRENQNTLLVGISHDLRSPLARLRMALGMLAEERESPLVARMESDVAAMDALIGAQLAFARAREREPASPTDVDAVLGEIVAAAGGQAPEAIRLRTSGIRCLATLAPVALRRILSNLIDNACIHGATQGVEVVRRCCGSTVLIGVRDRGPGIPPELRNAVFRPYFRIEVSRSRATGGSGLGLAIARQLADTHGWQLALKARVGGGASFWLGIPRAASAVPESPSAMEG